ncbi:MAG: hypothetical protein MJZ90_12050 [Bacteroidales bacterium]|nr:hypothetical protein [Bacteroidales bacterium]
MFSSKKEGGTSMWSASSSPTDFQTIPANALYADYKAKLESYVDRLDVAEAQELAAGIYPTEDSFKNKIKSWVKTIWLSAKNNTKWTQAGVIQAAEKSGVTYNQQIVKDAIWEMGQETLKRITGNDEQKRAFEIAVDELQHTVEDM